jgi:hypothetical protein
MNAVNAIATYNIDALAAPQAAERRRLMLEHQAELRRRPRHLRHRQDQR